MRFIERLASRNAVEIGRLRNFRRSIAGCAVSSATLIGTAASSAVTYTLASADLGLTVGFVLTQPDYLSASNATEFLNGSPFTTCHYRGSTCTYGGFDPQVFGTPSGLREYIGVFLHGADFRVSFAFYDAALNRNGFYADTLGGVYLSISGSPDTAPPPLPAVPEPATWALLITGFGLTGAALRRRRTLAAI